MEAIDFVKQKGSRKLLETLLKFPKRMFAINESSREAGVPFASTWRIVKRWEAAGIIETGKVGNSVTVKLHESEYSKAVTKLLGISMSPQAFTAGKLKALFAKERDVEDAYIFGSVASGEEKLMSDIDVAVVSNATFDANKLIFTIYEKYGTKIVPIVFKDKDELDSFLKGKKTVKLK